MTSHYVVENQYYRFYFQPNFFFFYIFKMCPIFVRFPTVALFAGVIEKRPTGSCRTTHVGTPVAVIVESLTCAHTRAAVVCHDLLNLNHHTYTHTSPLRHTRYVQTQSACLFDSWFPVFVWKGGRRRRKNENPTIAVTILWCLRKFVGEDGSRVFSWYIWYHLSYWKYCSGQISSNTTNIVSK